MSEYEDLVCSKYVIYLSKAKTTDEVFSTYRKVNTWLQIHYHYGAGCSRATYLSLTDAIKEARDKRLYEIEISQLLKED